MGLFGGENAHMFPAMSSQILLVWVCANDSMSAKSLRKGSVLARVSIILA